VGIAERVDALGGRFRAGPVASGGWELVARLPVAPR
jgi:signal transduction histidine kinase